MPFCQCAGSPHGIDLGTLQLASGEPVANATLSLLPAFGAYVTTDSHRALTDDLGRFVVENMQSGDFRFLVSAPGDRLRDYSVVGPEGPRVHLAPGEEQ